MIEASMASKTDSMEDIRSESGEVDPIWVLHNEFCAILYITTMATAVPTHRLKQVIKPVSVANGTPLYMI